MVYSDFEEGQYETNKSDDGTSVDFNLSNDEVRKRQLFQGGRNFESHMEEKIHDSCSTKKIKCTCFKDAKTRSLTNVIDFNNASNNALFNII